MQAACQRLTWLARFAASATLRGLFVHERCCDVQERVDELLQFGGGQATVSQCFDEQWNEFCAEENEYTP